MFTPRGARLTNFTSTKISCRFGTPASPSAGDVVRRHAVQYACVAWVMKADFAVQALKFMNADHRYTSVDVEFFDEKYTGPTESSS
jgi:hypothetical protein